MAGDIEAARDALVHGGVEVGEIYHYGPEGKAPGVHPTHEKYNSFAELADPDGSRGSSRRSHPAPDDPAGRRDVRVG